MYNIIYNRRIIVKHFTLLVLLFVTSDVNAEATSKDYELGFCLRAMESSNIRIHGGGTRYLASRNTMIITEPGSDKIEIINEKGSFSIVESNCNTKRTRNVYDELALTIEGATGDSQQFGTKNTTIAVPMEEIKYIINSCKDVKNEKVITAVNNLLKFKGLTTDNLQRSNTQTTK